MKLAQFGSKIQLFRQYFYLFLMYVRILEIVNCHAKFDDN